MSLIERIRKSRERRATVQGQVFKAWDALALEVEQFLDSMKREDPEEKKAIAALQQMKKYLDSGSSKASEWMRDWGVVKSNMRIFRGEIKQEDLDRLFDTVDKMLEGY